MTVHQVTADIDGRVAPTIVSVRRRWGTLVFLFLATSLNLLDRQVVNILAERIRLDLHLNDAQLGMLTGSAFGLMYAVFTIPMSRLSDHVSRTRLVAVAMALWSVLTMCCGLASGFVSLALARMGVGVGEAGSQSASASLIVDCFPPRQRGIAMAIFYLGMPVGGCLGLLIGASVASSLGWRAAFFIAGAPGAFLGLAMWISLFDPRPHSGSGFGQVIRSLRLGAAIRQLFGDPAYRLAVLASIGGIAVYYVVQSWLPVYFVRVQHMSMMQTAAWMSAAMATGGTIGSVGSGWICDRLRSRVRQPETLILTISLIASCPVLALTALATNQTLAIAGLFVTYPLAFGFLTPGTLLIQKTAPEDLRGIAIGIWASTTNVVVLTVILPLVGLASDFFGRTHGVRGLPMAIAASSLIALVCAAVMARAGTAMNRREG